MTLEENGLAEAGEGAREGEGGRNRHLSEVSIAKVAPGPLSEHIIQ